MYMYILIVRRYIYCLVLFECIWIIFVCQDPIQESLLPSNITISQGLFLDLVTTHANRCHWVNPIEKLIPRPQKCQEGIPTCSALYRIIWQLSHLHVVIGSAISQRHIQRVPHENPPRRSMASVTSGWRSPECSIKPRMVHGSLVVR